MNFNAEIVELENALTKEYNVLRYWMIPSLMHVLSENKHNEYPQHIFDMGTVFKENNEKETHLEEATRLGIALCNPKADFTEIKQILDYLFRALGISYDIEEAEHDSFIKGRVGRVSYHGKKIAYIGEIYPKVLENWELEMPVAVLELNLTDLFEELNKK